ncbi:MAG TPA: hypothetical protein PLB26_06880 [Rubrivivax sp.]|nr:hypothetical protein [Rubrivivax sp.]
MAGEPFDPCLWEADPVLVDLQLRAWILRQALLAVIAELRRLVDRQSPCCLTCEDYERARRVIADAEHDLRRTAEHPAEASNRTAKARSGLGR